MTTSGPPRLPTMGDVVQGRFRIETVLGQGGMGIVFGAKEVGTERPVALKVLAPEASVHRDAIGRFVNEARAAMQLQSRHVVKVYEVGTLDVGLPFLVMEMLQGSDLAAVLEARKTLPVTEAVDYLIQAADAIADAHTHNIVHRDLKPSNLFLAHGNVVKVLDFGVSKVQPAAHQQGLRTATGAVLGSPHYMAPEQLKSAKDADPRADIWSLGVILYELLAGRPPFDGRAYGDLFMAVLSGEFVPLASVRSDAPPGLEQIIARCLKKSRDERFSNVAELVSALRPFSGRPAAKRALAATALMQDRPRFDPHAARVSASVGAAAPISGHMQAAPPSQKPSHVPAPRVEPRAPEAVIPRRPSKALPIAIAISALLALLGLVVIVVASRLKPHAPTTEQRK
jgi:eukaryotic-like serine/threonine-protein kinase